MSNSNPIKQFYKPNEKYLFLGNGINLLSKDLSWETLLKRISDDAHVKVSFENKTYPLIFEEIAFKTRTTSFIEHNISYLRKIVGKECAKFSPNEFHGKILDLNFYNHFITTNYDYCIENSIKPDIDLQETKNKKNPKYSLNRFNLVKGKKVWHIHGEIDNGLRGNKINKEESILIGNEHYGDYQIKIHGLLKSPTGAGLFKLMSHSEENWVHLFFSRDIDIIGFGMDFNETHLWWMLNFRARMKRKGTSIANKICFYYPSFSAAKLKSKIDLLETLDIKTIPIQAAKDNYKAFYNNFIKAKAK